tara:strand:- start:1010 stop:1627 length:618 start_codon:yes stop_codon:yes gene_type:complete
MQIIRKDMPLKGWIVTYETMIKDPKMDKQIKKIIDGQGDRQNNKSNVQAQMTEWVMQDEPGFKKLADIVKTMAIECSLKQYNRRIIPEISDMWGMKYKSNDYTFTHDHWPALWSFAYYLNAPKNAPGLFFPQMGEQGGERKLEPGLLIMFPGHIQHAVRKVIYRGYRYVVSANVYDKAYHGAPKKLKQDDLKKVIKLDNYENLKV